MTTAQLTALKTDLLSKTNVTYQGNTLGSYMANTNLQMIANYYNSNINPQVDIWKPDLKVEDMAKSLDMATFITLTAVKQNGYFALTKGTYVDATVANVRASFVTIFGNGTANAVALAAIAKRPATIFEALFTTSNVSSVYGYVIQPEEIQEALQL